MLSQMDLEYNSLFNQEPSRSISKNFELVLEFNGNERNVNESIWEIESDEQAI